MRPKPARSLNPRTTARATDCVVAAVAGRGSWPNLVNRAKPATRGRHSRLLQRLLETKRLNFSSEWPFGGALRQVGPDWIIANIVPFLVVAFFATQEMIEKFPLPNRACSRGRCPRHFGNSPTAPTFPCSDKSDNDAALGSGAQNRCT